MKSTVICFFAFAAWLACTSAQANRNLNPIIAPAMTSQTSKNLTTSANQKQLYQVQHMLSHVNKLSGKFQQTQQIQLLANPLVSSGHFVLAKSTGLTWHQTKPFKSSLIVTSSKIEQRLANNPPTIITKEQQPIVFSFTNIFLSVFNGDTKTIAEYFNIAFKGNTTKWNITLTPIGAPLNKAIASIELVGSKYVNAITINEAKNNRMIIKFYNVTER